MFEYLTEEEKIKKLKDLAGEIANDQVDLKIIPWLFKINQLAGVVTTQSCYGHIEKDGYISLRFSRRRGQGKKYERFVTMLAKSNNTRWVEADYEVFGNYVRPRVVIRFKETNAKNVLQQIVWLLIS